MRRLSLMPRCSSSESLGRVKITDVLRRSSSLETTLGSHAQDVGDLMHDVADSSAAPTIPLFLLPTPLSPFLHRRVATSAPFDHADRKEEGEMGRVDPNTRIQTMLFLEAAHVVGGAAMPFTDSTKVSRASVDRTLREVRANDAGEPSASIHMLRRQAAFRTPQSDGKPARRGSLFMEPQIDGKPTRRGSLFMDDLGEVPAALDVKARSSSFRRRHSSEISSRRLSGERRVSVTSLSTSPVLARPGDDGSPRPEIASRRPSSERRISVTRQSTSPVLARTAGEGSSRPHLGSPRRASDVQPRRGSSVKTNLPLSLTQLYKHMKTRVDQRVREV